MYELKIFYDWDASDTVGAVSAGSGLIGGIWDAITASHRQADANNFAVGMYEKQRADALSDWNMQNAYNSPAAVMSRYKNAGLNPNLIYGSQGLVSPAVRPASQGSPPPIAPATAGKAIADVLPQFLDTRMKQAEIDNTRQMLDNMRSDNLIKQADLVKKNMENIITSYNPLISDNTPEGRERKKQSEEFRYNMDTGIKQEMWNNLTRTGNLLGEQTTSARLDNAVKAALQESNITIGMQKAFQSLMDSAKSKFEVDNLNLMKQKMLNDLELQKLEIDMQNGGFNSKSPLWQKLVGGLIDAAVMYSSKGMVSTGKLGEAIQSINPADPSQGYRLLQTRTYQKR